MKKKDTFYFTHDFGARNDPKLVKLRVQLGYEAIGVYWSLIEYLYEQKGYLFVSEIEIIAESLHTNAELLEKIVKNFSLFCIKNNRFYSKAINKRLKLRAEKSQKYSKNAENRWKKEKTKAMQLHYKSDAIALQSLSNCNALKERKGKERKGKERKGNNIYIETSSNKEKINGAVKTFDYVLVGNNNFQTKRKLNFPQLLITKYQSISDFKIRYNSWKDKSGKADDILVSEYADTILKHNELDSSGINSNLKQELQNYLKEIIGIKE